jgi:hypothetical protein
MAKRQVMKSVKWWLNLSGFLEKNG